MKDLLKPHQLVAHWVPGLLVVAGLMIADRHAGFARWNAYKDALGVTSGVITLAILAFAAGELVDSLRDLLETPMDWCKPINWQFIWTFGKDDLQKMEDYYFTYYVFNFNSALALLIDLGLFFLFAPKRWPPIGGLLNVFVLVAVFVLILDALSLRNDIAQESHNHEHHAVQSENKAEPSA